MDIKIIFTSISILIGTIGFFPYLKDIFLLKTKPHAYTWFIWAITQGTATFGVWYGGGSWGALSLTIGTLFIITIFLFSLKFGTKNITKSDTVILITALLAIIIWWQLKQPLISVLMVTAIDVIGYIPSFRKLYQEPWSETLTFWALSSASGLFVLLALKEYNLLTVTYLVAATVANTILFFLGCFRRRFISKSQTK